MSDEPIALHRPVRRFRRRVFFYLLTLSLVTSVVSGATFYARQVKFIEKDRARRAHTLLTSLATQAELGAYAGDAALCDLPARRTFREEDVVLAGVYDASGREILRLAQPALGTPPPPPMETLRPLLRDPDAAPLGMSREEWDDLWAPIVTTARPAAVALSSEPGGPAAPREVVGLARVGLSMTGAREQLAEVLRTGVYLACGLLTLGALAALLISGKLSDPILALARGADEIRAGNLDVTIEVRSRDEIGLLAESFNRMAARLRRTMAELEDLNRGLEAEVSRRTEEIRRTAEFTQVLNAPIQRDPEGKEVASDLRGLLEAALGSLEAATGIRASSVLLTWEEAVEFQLQVAATRGAEARSFGVMPTREDLAAGRPILSEGRALVPILFRGEPEGALVLRQDPVPSAAVEFAARAAGPLAIAIANSRAYATLQHLAEELKTRNAALVKQRDQLSEMNRLKSEFLANVSHELRTPLNAIVGYAELIAEGVYGVTTAEQREGLQGIGESSQHLLALINQILDLSKVEAGKVELIFSDVDLTSLALEVAAEAQGLTKDRPYRVEVRGQPGVGLRTDRVKLQQILTNLVSNAIKFTERGSVVVTVEQASTGACTITVRDTGIGIRAEDQELIFEEFRQVDGSSTRKYGGTGLGLAIARRFASLLGGSLSVESAPGLGSTFTLELRAARKPSPRTGATPPPPPLGRST